MPVSENMSRILPAIYNPDKGTIFGNLRFKPVACLPPTSLLQAKVASGEIDPEILKQVQTIKDEFLRSEYKEYTITE
jgi:hypothetical protein